MGGNVFGTTAPIKREDIKPTLLEFFREFKKIFPKAHAHFTGIKTIGSVGKKEISGDIDLVLAGSSFDNIDDWGLDKKRVQDLFTAFKSRARTASEEQSMRRAVVVAVAEIIQNSNTDIVPDIKQAGSGQLFLMAPQFDETGKRNGSSVQIDINIGDVDWLEFSHYSAVYKGNVKGLHRTQLLVAMFSHGGYTFSHAVGVKTKDIDFTFVLDDLNKTVEQGFQEMEQWMTDRGFTIFLSVPEMFTIRAKFPVDHKFAKLDADFVMARKEIGYVEGTRRPILELGTLEDDLLRRDFTVNAMAEDEDGNIIDLFDGKLDLERMVLITPKAPQITFDEDPLRIIRAIRFSITKGFSLKYLDYYINNFDYEGKMGVVCLLYTSPSPRDRLKHDTLRTLEMLDYFPVLKQYVFKNNVLWLKPTFEQ